MAISDETRAGGGPLPSLAPRASIGISQSEAMAPGSIGLPAQTLSAPAGAPAQAIAPTPPAQLITGHRALPRPQMRRWQFAADVISACGAATLAVSCWSIYGRSAGVVDTATFALASAVFLVAATGRTRGVSGSAVELLRRRGSRFGALSVEVAAAALTIGLLGSLGAFGNDIPLPVVASLLVSGLVLIPCSRALAKTGAAPLRVILIGHGSVAREMHARLKAFRHVDLKTVYSDSVEACAEPSVLERFCRDHRADELLIALCDPSEPETPTGKAACARKLGSRARGGPNVEVLLSLQRLLPVQVAIQLSPGSAPVIFSVGREPRLIYRTLKRALDITVSSLALLVLTPLLLFLMASVGLDSGFPLLFRQRRVGEGGKTFEIFKLRTMRPAPAKASLNGFRTPFSHLADPMLVTRVGGLLRRTALDEIPQLINVLRGEMSLVGPRPFVQEECDSLPAWAAPRFATRPGMTGMWQVCGQHSVSVEDLCWLDVFYVSCWSPAADLRILLLTPARLLRGSV